MMRRNEIAESPVMVPYRTDYLFRLVSIVARKSPFLSGALYFLVEFVGVYTIGLLTGQFNGKNGLPPMYSQVLDNINMGFLAPVGAGLLCHLYNTITNAFQEIKREGLIPPEELAEYDNLLLRLGRLYNDRTTLLLAFLVPFLFNIYNYIMKTNSWLGINGGITGAYGRLFAGLNYFILALIIYKCIITVWGLRRTLRFSLRIRPFHPDRSGGLRPIGRLAVAVNYFVTLVVVYFTLTLVFDEFARQNPVYISIFILFYPLSVMSFFGSLSSAHKKMAKKKEEVLYRLGVTFEYYYQKLTSGSGKEIYDIDSADEIAKIHALYEIADRMPVWPFDVRTMARFGSSLALPALIFAINLIVNADSIIYNSDKLKQLLLK
jgi:hypothetical protein